MKIKEFNKDKGESGEALAVKYLKKQKYKILETNYSNKLGEIDIIAQKKFTTVFVEVKYRTSEYFGLPREAVGEYKQRKLRQVATGYMVANNLLEERVRFDVIDILNGKITHIENAF